MFELVYNLKNIRLERGLSLGELSKITGISKSFLFYIENNQKHPTLYTLCQIATALDIDVCSIYTYRSL